MTTRTSNPLGIHALVWAKEWNTANAEKAVAQAAETGFDLIEMPMLDPGAIDVPTVRRALDAACIDVRCSLGLPFDADISSEDPHVVSDGEALLARALEASSALGASMLTGVLYSALGKYESPPTGLGWSNAAQALRRLSDRAEGLGVTLGLEVVNRYESNLINTAADARRMIDDIGRDNVVIHLDTYHMNIEEGDFAGPVFACGDRLGYIHVGESHRGYLGAGVVDFATLFRALVDVGYRGAITFESFSAPSTPADLAGTLAVWRRNWEDAKDVAVQARGYIEAVLAAARKGRPEFKGVSYGDG
ncbi:MAG: sugar phosphate isomerase/epimerase family protein [Actinomycetes bacterium]